MEKIACNWAINFHYVSSIINTSADILFVAYLFVYIKG